MIPLAILAADDWLHHPRVLEELGRDFDVHDFGGWRAWDEPTLAAKCRSVEIALTSRRSPKLPAALAGDFGRLRWLCHCHGTIRHLADRSLLEAGLLVTNWGDHVAGVAEGAMALLLCQLKQLVTLGAHVKGGADERVWQEFDGTLEGLAVGLYGFGPIGRHMARMLAPFGARIAVYDPYAAALPAGVRRCATLRELFATCQAVSIHCGLNDQTRDSVGGELLDLLPQGAVVVNTARGHVVDEAALAERVAAGRLLAGIDVIRDERNWPASPLAPLPGAVLTGHRVETGKGYPPGREPVRALPDYVVRNLAAYRAGRPLEGVVTAAEYDRKT
jgi:phosphoglycerate dehydrogenase-like enzyme